MNETIQKRTQKGGCGYIRSRKRQQLLKILAGVCAVAVFVVGAYFVPAAYHNIMLVMGILCVLPTANFLVNLIALLPYKDVAPEEYEQIRRMAGTGLLDTGLNITANKLPTIPLAYVYVHPLGVAALTRSERIDVGKSEEYIASLLRMGGIDLNVKIFTKEKQFCERIRTLQETHPVDGEHADEKLLQTQRTLRAVSL